MSSMLQQTVILAKAIMAISKQKWEKFDSDSKKQGWKREKSDGKGYEYLYQDNDPNVKENADSGLDDNSNLTKKPIIDLKYKLTPEQVMGNPYFVKLALNSKSKLIDSKAGIYSVLAGNYGDEIKIVKPYKGNGGLLQIKNEILANRLYNEAQQTRGLSSIGLTYFKGAPAFISDPEPSDEASKTEKEVSAKTGFIMDCWLGNDKSIGPNLNNLRKQYYGVVSRIKNGSSILFDDVGKLKQDFGDDATTEVKTMKDSSVLPEQAAVFGDIDDDEIAVQISLLVKRFSDDRIREIVERVFDVEKDVSEFLINKLIKRRDSLKDLAVKIAKEKIQKKIVKRKERYNISPMHTGGELNQAERSAIRAYTGNGYEDINKFLREDEEYNDNSSYASELKSRTKTIVNGLKKLPAYTGKVYRGTNLDQHTMVVLSTLKPNDVIYMKAFTSTSLDSNQAFSKDVKFIITSKTGRYIEEYSGVKEEREVLFAPDSRFKVIRVKPGIYETEVELEEILPDEMRNAQPVNFKKKLTAIDIKNFLLKNPKLSQKQRERIQRLSSDDLFAIAFAIFAKSEKKGKGGQSAEQTDEEIKPQTAFGTTKFSEIFI